VKPIDISHAHRIAVERDRRIVVLDVGRGGLLGRETRRHGGPSDQARNRLKVDCLGDVEELEENNLRRTNLAHAARILQPERLVFTSMRAVARHTRVRVVGVPGVTPRRIHVAMS
jgi:hypothetical protein